MFYPYVTISATQKVTIYATRCRRFLSCFSGLQRILGYVRPRRIVAVHPPKTGRRRSIWRRLQIWAVSWRNWPSNIPPEDADCELSHRNCLRLRPSTHLSIVSSLCNFSEEQDHSVSNHVQFKIQVSHIILLWHNDICLFAVSIYRTSDKLTNHFMESNAGVPVGSAPGLTETIWLEFQTFGHTDRVSQRF